MTDTADLHTSTHHFEMWMSLDRLAVDYGTWGWQCFTCRTEEGGFPSRTAAEAAGERHQPNR